MTSIEIGHLLPIPNILFLGQFQWAWGTSKSSHEDDSLYSTKLTGFHSAHKQKVSKKIKGYWKILVLSIKPKKASLESSNTDTANEPKKYNNKRNTKNKDQKKGTKKP